MTSSVCARWLLGIGVLASGCLNVRPGPEAASQPAGTSGITPANAHPATPGEPALSPFLVVDQFGYPTNSEKVVVVRDPVKGYDADQEFAPGKTYALVDAATKAVVYKAAVTPWSKGAVDESSGDHAWWFDFSSVTTPGTYYVEDVDKNVRSPKFKIGDDVYRVVLKHAMRMFYYQRAGFPKEAKYAGEAWADGPSHLGPLQDSHCRAYNAKDDAKTERDLHGGWYDAGDFNKYTSWAAQDVIGMLHAYEENPQAFADDYDIPESGNGIPDIIDEIKWDLDWLERMQEKDGSLLSIVSLAGGSPPSSATGQSVYGTPNTSGTLSTAAAFAYASKVFGKLDRPELKPYAEDLLARAQRAWKWAEAHPKVIFRNNDAKSGTQGVGSGQQEDDDAGRFKKKLMAALYLFDATGDAKFRDVFEKNIDAYKQIKSAYVGPFDSGDANMLLYYSRLPGATPAVADRVRAAYKAGIEGSDMLGSSRKSVDPYRAFLKDYTWASNSVKSGAGDELYDAITYGVNPALNAELERAAIGYLHYLHGVNPFGVSYLSNMSVAGAERSVSELYHTWFCDGSPKWDRVTPTTPGPPPGYLTGGPNSSYDWDGCCPNRCGNENNAKCHAESITPPKGQPQQKSYKDFNTSWPLDSWSVTEPDVGYQVNYIRLLSKFVKITPPAPASAQ